MWAVKLNSVTDTDRQHHGGYQREGGERAVKGKDGQICGDGR